MTISFNKLPKELLLMIVENIDSTKDLLQLQLICKDWSPIAYEQLYKSIYLNKIPLLSLVHILIESKYKPRLHVKVIEFGKRLPCQSVLGLEEGSYFPIIIRLCPNITHLRVTELKTPETLYAKLLALQNRGYLQYLQYLPNVQYLRSFRNVGFRDTYNSTALTIKETLARLYIMERNRYLSLQTSNIILFQHIQDFPQLKELFVLYSAIELFYEANTWIDECEATLECVRVRLDNNKASVERPQCPVLDLKKAQRNPNIRDLVVCTNTFTMRDFDYIQLKFSGLEKLIIKLFDVPNDDIVDKLAADDILLSQRYIDFFHYMISSRYFGIINFSLVYGVSETLTYWRKRPEFKEIKIEEPKVDDREAILLTVLNTKISNEISYFDIEDPEDGSLQLTIDTYYHDFKGFY